MTLPSPATQESGEGLGVRAEMQTTPVTFHSAGTRLSGSLTLPAGPDPHAVVILLHGASWGLRSFYDAYVEAFVEAGVGCFVFDRRGEGESEGSPAQDIFAFARDAEAAFAHVRTLPGVDPARVGLWGYSNGAWVATLAASRLPDCAFLVLTGAAGVSPGASEAFRRSEDLRAQGVSQPTVDAVRAAWLIVFDYLAHGDWRPEWERELAVHRAVIAADQALGALPVSDMVRDKPWLDSVPRFERPPLRDLQGAPGGSNPDMGFDPIPALRELGCPTLIVLAEHDQNLPSGESARRFNQLAIERPEPPIRVEVLPTDHQFGVEVRYPPSPPAGADFLPGYLELMAGWVRNETR